MAQTRPLSELIDAKNPAWPEVQRSLLTTTNKAEVLPRDPQRADEALLEVQITTASTLGAVIHQTGGLLIDGGFVRVLGSGSERMAGSVTTWNPQNNGMFIVAHDVLGGVFALDGGALGPGKGGAYYFAPDSLRWEDLERGYSELFAFFLRGDLEQFYGEYRWKSWREDVAALSADQGFSFQPPLFSKEGKDIESASRRPVPMTQLVAMQQQAARQLNALG